MLVFFVENHDRLIPHDDLMKAVWKDTFVDESNLRISVHALRKALGKNADGKDFVKTVPKRGYRFIAEIREKNSANIPENIDSKDVSGEMPVPESLGKSPPGRRNRLIGLAAVLIAGLLILAAVRQRSVFQPPENPPETNTLAVLPFSSINENDGDLRAGLNDELITNLSKLKNLKVLPLALVRRYAGKNFDPLAAGRELRAARVLAGSYRFDGENVRVTVNLLRVSSGETLWSETFTAKRKSNLDLEAAIARRASRLFSLKFAEIEDEKFAADQSLNREAVQNYLAGRRIWQTRELGRHDEMIKHFEKAIELAPAWSHGFSGLAEALLNDDSYAAGWEKIEQAARRARALDDTDAQAHTALAQIYFLRYWDWENAERSFKRAFELNPDYAHAHNQYGVFLGLRRRFVEAEAELKKAIETEPFSPFYYASLCELYYFDHRFDEALTACSDARNLEAEFWRTRKNLFQIYVQKKMYAEMSEMVLGNLSEAEKAAHPLTGAADDLRPFWQKLIDESLNSKNPDRNAVQLANFYLQLGEKEKSLTYLETAFRRHDDSFPAVNADPSFDPLRKEPRFLELMSRAGLRK